MFPGDPYAAYLVIREQRMDRLREADKDRLIRIALQGQERRGYLYPQLLAWLGSQLVRYGQRLQARYGVAVKPQADPRAS
jgi:hypothetical protein